MVAACSARILSLLACVALAACSGAGNEDLFEASGDQADQASTLPAPTTPTGTNDAPKTNTPAKPAQPAPTPTAKCTQEDEPNNDQRNATEFDTSICGKIDGNGDTDYASFEVPEDALNVTFKHTETGGKATYRFFLNGLQVSQSADDELRALPGATYTVQVRGQNGDRPSYQLDVTFQ
jgi:hypothetical protein